MTSNEYKLIIETFIAVWVCVVVCIFKCLKFHISVPKKLIKKNKHNKTGIRPILLLIFVGFPISHLTRGHFKNITFWKINTYMHIIFGTSIYWLNTFSDAADGYFMHMCIMVYAREAQILELATVAVLQFEGKCLGIIRNALIAIISKLWQKIKKKTHNKQYVYGVISNCDDIHSSWKSKHCFNWNSLSWFLF